jgi:hypothetical protein
VLVPRLAEAAPAIAKLGIAARLASWATTSVGAVTFAGAVAIVSVGVWRGIGDAVESPRSEESAAPRVAASRANDEHPGPAEATKPTRSAEVETSAAVDLSSTSPSPSAARGTVSRAPRPRGDAVSSGADRRGNPAAPADVADLDADTRLLNDARESLRQGDARQALERISDHEARFDASPQGDLRAALRIDALCLLGRTDEAREIADDLLKTHPRTPVADRIARSCAAAG